MSKATVKKLTRRPSKADETCAGGERDYTVEEGDTWQSVAEKLGVTVKDLTENNYKRVTAALRAGQVLHVPQ